MAARPHRITHGYDNRTRGSGKSGAHASAGPQGQRLQHSDRDCQRVGIAVSQHRAAAQSIFRMGIPVSGKNLFPSNIAGLPTWYTIRASKDGYVARKKEIDFLVAMNPETAQEDMISLLPGAACDL